MKKWLVLILLPAMLWACNSNEPASAHHHEEKLKAGELQLNEGKKWNADEPTFASAEKILSIMENMSLYKNKTHQVYVNTAIELETRQEELVKQCRMKGADHDALHLWLEPLMKKTADLKNSGNAEDASRIFDDLHSHVKLFKQYFE